MSTFPGEVQNGAAVTRHAGTGEFLVGQEEGTVGDTGIRHEAVECLEILGPGQFVGQAPLGCSRIWSAKRTRRRVRLRLPSLAVPKFCSPKERTGLSALATFSQEVRGAFPQLVYRKCGQ